MADLQRDRLGQRPLHTEGTGGDDEICPGFVRGIDHLRDPHLNKVSTNFILFNVHNLTQYRDIWTRVIKNIL
jgi:hypothetical protein